MGSARKVGILRSDQRHDQWPPALAEQGGKHQCQKDGGERQLQVDDAHDERLDAPTHKAGQRAQRGAQRKGDGAGHETHLQRDAQPVQDRREQVAPLRVGAQPMGEALAAHITWRAAGIHQHEVGEVVGVLRRDPRRQQRQQHDQREHHEGDNGDAVLRELAQEAAQGSFYWSADSVHDVLRARRRGSRAA